MNYKQTLEYLYEQLPMYHRVGPQAYKADLGNTLALCRMLDDPHRSFPSVHITGTNGKGSVSHMLASVLQEAGYRTGLYTSPHLKDFRERIRVNGKMIGKRSVTTFIRQYRSRFESIRPSFFELTVAMAFDHFRRESVDVAVIEVGLGGRLDSTNIITPLVSVITNVSFDHMQLLGDTLEKIASEKAGIIKPGIPVVVGESQPESLPVFLQRAEALGSTVCIADRVYRATFRRREKEPGSACLVDVIRQGKPFLEGIESPLAGIYQQKNIQTLLAVCEILEPLGLPTGKKPVRKGIAGVIRNTGLAGRWQTLSHRPLTICDTGHNEGGLREILAQIDLTPHRRLHFVMGVVNDKHLAPILDMLPRDADYYFCRPDIPRGLDAGELQRQAREAGLHGDLYPSVGEALEEARRAAGPDDLVFVGGSTFVVAEVV